MSWDHEKDYKGGLGHKVWKPGDRRFCLHLRCRTKTVGIWFYSECLRCGRRKATRTSYRLMGPVDMKWITGKWDGEPGDSPMPPPPRSVGGLVPLRPEEDE